MKKNIFIFSLMAIVSVSQAQIIVTKPVIFPKTVIPDPVITSPTAGAEISGPFVIVGKARPNANITLHVFPIYKRNPKDPGNGRPVLISSSREKEYNQQDFTLLADASGKWQSPIIEVKFYKDATDKKIHVFSAQQVGNSSSKGKMIAYKVFNTVFIGTTGTIKLNSLSIKSPSDKSIVQSNTPISGTAQSGAVVKVIINSGYYPIGSTSWIRAEKQELYATAGSDGKWNTNVANFNIIHEAYTKSTYQIIATVEGTNEKKEINIIRPSNNTVSTSSFSVTSPRNFSMFGAASTFKIKGVAEPNAKIEVVLSYTGTYTNEYDSPILGGDSKTVSNVKNGDFETLKTTTNVNGEWEVTTSLLQVRVSSDGDFKYTKVAATMFAKISLVDGNGKRLKTVELNFLNSFK